MGILGEKVGRNFDMTGDRHIGGEKVPCEKGCIAQIKSTKKVKHFTIIGITNLIGEPICCILIIEVKEEPIDIRASIDFYKEKFGYKRDG